MIVSVAFGVGSMYSDGKYPGVEDLAMSFDI